MGRYHHALQAELVQFAHQYEQAYAEKMRVTTLFIGGGTPSTYPDDLLLDTFGTLERMMNFSEGAEITIEVNPGTVRQEQLGHWKKCGINRLSIGVQSLNDAVLKGLNRHQSAEDVYALLAKASVLFDNLSVDLILGLPGVSDHEWRTLLEKVVTWPIKHVSMYFLTVHEHTPLYFKVKSKQVALPTDDAVVENYHWSIAWLKEHGFNQYEISNFAQSGYESRHNQVYWERLSYKGFGLGAWSFDGESRFQNQKNLMRYLEGMEKQEQATIFSERLTSEQVILEKVMLGFRRTKGMFMEELKSLVPQDKVVNLERTVVGLQDKNFITEKDGRLVLTPAGLAVENEIIITLLS